MLKKWTNKFIEIGLVLLALVLINVVASYFYTHLDLTEDKRFTLSDSTLEMVEGVEDNIFVQVLLDGNLEAGFKRLRDASEDMLSDFNSLNGNIRYDFFDPMEGTIEQRNIATQQLKELGVTPFNVTIMDGKEQVQKYIYPYAIIHHDNRNKVVVNLLEEQRLGVPNEIILNNSTSLLEYKFSDAIYRLTLNDKPNVVFLSGHGELEGHQTAAIERTLRDRYNTFRISLDSLIQINEAADILVVAKPKVAFPDKHQFIIDQYIMNGGKVIWLMDRFEVNVDSISQNKFYVPRPLELGLDDLFFRYGVKYKDNLVLDLNASKIPQITGDQGGKPQIQFYDWFYHPLVAPNGGHPITKNLDLINMYFPSSLDTVRTNADIKKEIILSSSEQSRFQVYPMRLNFEILKYKADPDKFDKGAQSIAILLTGRFDSNYRNRVGQEAKEMLSSIGTSFKEESPMTKQLFVTDGDFIKNYYNPQNQQVSQAGFNIFEEKAYKGNTDFLVNAIDFMTDDIGLIETRSKELKLHLLNTTKAKDEQSFWQFFNVALPLIFLIGFGILFGFLRKRKFS